QCSLALLPLGPRVALRPLADVALALGRRVGCSASAPAFPLPALPPPWRPPPLGWSPPGLAPSLPGLSAPPA
ncbi:hypothetical protein C3R30_21960, partial [Mycobacterium tuberculosis]